MPMMKRVLGLDLGSHSLKAVELRQTFRGLEPVQFRMQPRGPEGTTLASELRQFIEVHQLPTDHVTCALSSDRLSLHRMTFPFTDRKRLAQTVPFEVEGQIPFDLEDIVVDWDLVHSDGLSAEVAAALAQRRDISNMLADLVEAGAEPRIIEAEGLVLANLASVFDLSGRRLLVVLGHSKTTICLLVDGKSVANRCCRRGGRHITEAIAADLSCNLMEAERWKCEEGIFETDLTSRSPRALAVLDDIAREIVRSLDSVESNVGSLDESQLDCLTLMGGTSRLHRIDEYLTGRTGIVAVRLPLPPVAEDAALVAGDDHQLFANALALAFRTTARAKTRMNFRQDEFRYQTDLSQFFGKDLRATAILAGVLALLFLLSIGTSVFLRSGDADQLSRQVAQIFEKTFPGQAVPADPVAAMSSAVRSARDRADFLGVYGGNRSALDLLTELSTRVPGELDVIFDEITIEPKMIRIKVSGNDFATADRLIAALKSAAPFEQARVTGETKSVKERVMFSVSIPLIAEGASA
jgi:general secretion pathway protein L